MNKIIGILGLIYLLSSPLAAQTSGKRNDPNKPIPMVARRLAIRGVELAARDHVESGLLLLKRAIEIAPNYVWAHEEYVSIRTFNQYQYDEVRSEYERLAAKEPDNPIYPLVIAETSHAPVENARPLYEKVVALAPDWAWGHYAKALLADDKQLEFKASEYRRYVDQDETADAYSLVYVLENGLGRIDEAIQIAERWALRPEHQGVALKRLWQLRLTRAKESEVAKTELKTELEKLTGPSRDLPSLAAARSAYTDLLHDLDSAARVESKIRRIDPSWYPERGQRVYYVWRNESGVAWFRPVANHQAAIASKIRQLEDKESREKIAGLERLLILGLSRNLKIHIYQEILRSARAIKDDATYLKYGEKWRALEPGDAVLAANLAIAIVNLKGDLRRARDYSRLAEQATAGFHPARRTPNAPAEWFAFQFSEKRQRELYPAMRSVVLDAAGWVLCGMGDFVSAETRLRQSIALRPTERSLLHLAETLRGLNRTAEANAVAREANDLWLATLKKQLINRPAADFTLETIKGLKVTLSKLKNKVVLIDFWATWCAPCAEEMPHLVELYQKYKDHDFEILAISADSKSEMYKVGPFAETHKMTFPVLLDDGVSTLYQIKGYPTTIFIDRNGNIRYSASGFDVERPRVIEAVVKELLK